LARNLEVQVMAATRGDYRVWLRDGTVGLLRPQDLAPIPPDTKIGAPGLQPGGTPADPVIPPG
jgi:hypothetical protein